MGPKAAREPSASRQQWDPSRAARALAWMLDRPGLGLGRARRFLELRLEWSWQERRARSMAARMALVAALGLAGRALIWAAPESPWARSAARALLDRAWNLGELVARKERMELDGEIACGQSRAGSAPRL
jgi:hypothetical protein